MFVFVCLWGKRLTCGVRVKGGVKLFQYTTVVCFLSAHLCKPQCKQSLYFCLSGLGHSKSPGIFASSLLDGHNYGEICFKTLLVLPSFDLCVGKIMWLLSVCAYIIITMVRSYTGKYSLLPSVLLRVRSTSNNANSNKRVIFFPV